LALGAHVAEVIAARNGRQPRLPPRDRRKPLAKVARRSADVADGAHEVRDLEHPGGCRDGVEGLGNESSPRRRMPVHGEQSGATDMPPTDRPTAMDDDKASATGDQPARTESGTPWVHDVGRANAP